MIKKRQCCEFFCFFEEKRKGNAFEESTGLSHEKKATFHAIHLRAKYTVDTP
jgi:hypothetical protein